jgi:hypothetical protein
LTTNCDINIGGSRIITTNGVISSSDSGHTRDLNITGGEFVNGVFELANNIGDAVNLNAIGKATIKITTNVTINPSYGPGGNLKIETSDAKLILAGNLTVYAQDKVDIRGEATRSVSETLTIHKANDTGGELIVQDGGSVAFLVSVDGMIRVCGGGSAGSLLSEITQAKDIVKAYGAEGRLGTITTIKNMCDQNDHKTLLVGHYGDVGLSAGESGPGSVYLDTNGKLRVTSNTTVSQIILGGLVYDDFEPNIPD